MRYDILYVIIILRPLCELPSYLLSWLINLWSIETIWILDKTDKYLLQP